MMIIVVIIAVPMVWVVARRASTWRIRQTSGGVFNDIVDNECHKVYPFEWNEQTQLQLHCNIPQNHVKSMFLLSFFLSWCVMFFILHLPP